MHNSVAAIRAAHPRTSFVRPSARQRERRLGLLRGALPRLVAVPRREPRGTSPLDAIRSHGLVPAPSQPQTRSPLRRHSRFTWSRPGVVVERRSTTRDAARWQG